MQLLTAAAWLFRRPEDADREPVSPLEMGELTPAALLAAEDLDRGASAVVAVDGGYGNLDPVGLAGPSAPMRLVAMGAGGSGVSDARDIARHLTCPSEVTQVPEAGGLRAPRRGERRTT